MTALTICALALAAIAFHRVTSPNGWRAERARRLRLTRYWPEQYTEEYMLKSYGPDWVSKQSCKKFCTSSRRPLSWYDVQETVNQFWPVALAVALVVWTVVNEGRK